MNRHFDSHNLPQDVVVLVLLTFISLALRVWGVDFGLPFVYHPDEFQHVETGLNVLGGDWNPHRLNNPTLFKYGLAAEYALVYKAGRLAGTMPPMPEFKRAWRADPSFFYLLGRLTVALLGALTVPALYWLGRMAYNRRIGLLAATFLTVSFIHLRESHFAVSDVPATLGVVLALALAVRVLNRPGLARCLVAGLAVGLAASTKYTAGLALVSSGLAYMLANPARRLHLAPGPALGGLAATAVGFLAGTPYAVLDREMLLDDLQALVRDGSQGYKGLILDPDGGWLFYLKTLDWGLGPGLFALALLGLAYALYRHRREDLVLAAFPVVLYLFIGRQLMFFGRFILPAVPVLLLLAARLLVEATDRVPWPDRQRRLLLVTLTAIVLAQPAFSSLRFDVLLTRTDTRTLARDWIVANLLPGVRIAAEPYGPQLWSSPFEITYSDTGGLSDHDKTLADYRDDGYDYLVVSSFIYDRVLRSPEKQQARRDFYASLDAQADLVREFKPYAGNPPPFLFDHVYGPATALMQFDRPGPTIKVYRLRR
jgi:hypothetical protein